MLNKKIAVILIFLFIASILFSGCLGENKPTEKKIDKPNNQAPIGLISAPNTAYFGEIIEFSASESYDKDGNIVNYMWNFGDDETEEGKKVDHTYIFENDFNIDYPLVYSVSMFVTDNDGSLTATIRQIKVYPKEYKFYLNSQKLTAEKTSSDTEKIKGSGLLKIQSPKILTFSIDNSIIIQECTWNATLYLKKPRFAILNKISITIYDENGNEISNINENLGLFSLWKDKTINVKGSIDKEEEFKTLKITVYGFSLRKEITILYGGEKASLICFNYPIQKT